MMDVVCCAFETRRATQCCLQTASTRSESVCLEITYLLTEIYSCPMIDAFLI